jgi:acylphosphatase
VQGVGFRYSVKNLAHGFEVVGSVRNLSDGRVELVVEGEKHELEDFEKAIQESDVGYFIKQTQAHWSESQGGLRGFEIVR